MAYQLMRIPLYMHSNQDPTEKDAYCMEVFADKKKANEALATLNEFSLHPPAPMRPDRIHHFIKETEE